MQVVHDHFDDFAILEHIRIDISIHIWVRCFSLIDSESRIQCRHFGAEICVAVQSVSSLLVSIIDP